MAGGSAEQSGPITVDGLAALMQTQSLQRIRSLDSSLSFSVAPATEVRRRDRTAGCRNDVDVATAVRREVRRCPHPQLAGGAALAPDNPQGARVG